MLNEGAETDGTRTPCSFRSPSVTWKLGVGAVTPQEKRPGLASYNHSCSPLAFHTSLGLGFAAPMPVITFASRFCLPLQTSSSSPCLVSSVSRPRPQPGSSLTRRCLAAPDFGASFPGVTVGRASREKVCFHLAFIWTMTKGGSIG